MINLSVINAPKHLAVCKQMISGSFKNVPIRLQSNTCVCVCGLDLALNNSQELICHNTQPNHDTPF